MATSSAPISLDGSLNEAMISGSYPRARDANSRVGAVLDSYRLVELIGSGGMGEVYRAEHIRLGREVALKLLRPEYALRPESVARFFQEARAVQRNRHRNIVDVTDLDTLEDGTPFIIMELVDGRSLREWIVEHYQDTERVLHVFTQICDGLGAAHEVDIIHRDLKPDNVMVAIDHDGTDVAKLLDFGIAKLLNHEDEDYGWKTTEGFVMGTPAYMAPEQAGGLPIDARTDIYALGAIMYEMFTGQPVFSGKSAGEFVRKHLNEDPTPPSQTEGGADLDPRIEAIIMRCLEKEPEDRYVSSTALRRDLERVLAGETLGDEAATLPMRTGRASAAALSGTHSQPVSSRYASRSAHTPAKNETSMVFGDLPSTRVTGKKILWSVVPLAVAASAAAAWFYLRPQNTQPVVQQEVATEAENSSATSESETSAKPTVTIEQGEDPADPGKETTAGANLKSEPEGPTPTVAPIVTEQKSISIRFDSKPKAEVYEWGSRQAQCTTPCDVKIIDDGSPTRRIILSREGYYPEIVTINLAKPRKKIRTKLRRKRRGRGGRVVARPDGVIESGSSDNAASSDNTKDGSGDASSDKGEDATKDGSGDASKDGSGDTAKDPAKDPAGDTAKDPAGDSKDPSSEDKSPDSDPDGTNDNAKDPKPDPDSSKEPDNVSPSDTLNPFKD